MKKTDFKYNNNNKKKIVKEQINNVDSFANGNTKNQLINFPPLLYRYCRFDEKGHYLDALEKQYLYLAPFDSMDDQFEGALNLPNIKDTETLEKIYGPAMMRYFLKKAVKANHQDMSTYNKYLKELEECEYSFEKMTEKSRELSIINGKQNEFEEMERFFKSDEYREQSDAVAKLIAGYREKLGISSLCEVNDSQIMWQLYGDNYKGFIVEYSITKEDVPFLSMLYPVIYQKKRDFDPIQLYIDIFGNNIFKDPNLIQNVKEFMVFSLLTKNLEWQLQKEWRLIGAKGQKVNAPSISGVYISKKIDPENLKIILDLQNKMGFTLYEMYNNYETTCIDYKVYKREGAES